MMGNVFFSFLSFCVYVSTKVYLGVGIFLSFFTVLEVSGAEGLVRETISWMAKRSLSRCRGLLMPISR